MVLEAPQSESTRPAAWPWRVGMIVENAPLDDELTGALGEMNAGVSFRARPDTDAYELATLVERQKPDVLFVELSRVAGSLRTWIEVVRSAGRTLIAAVHVNADPIEMIAALRAGACEFIHLPARPAIFDAMDRIGTLLESSRDQATGRGFVSGFVSAKGGCGATTVACYVGAACAQSGTRALVADLDHQAPAAHRIFRARPRKRVADAFEAVRRLNAANWHEYVSEAGEGLDLLAGAESGSGEPPDSWRIDNLFRFATRHYARMLVDLGRNLNPANWAFLHSLDELIVVTAPDVPALYQTRQILQTLTSRGFDRGRVRLILNRNHMAPEDFWVESIEQMFEMGVLEVIPNDYGTLNGTDRAPFGFPGNTQLGRVMLRLAGKLITEPGGARAGERGKAL